MRNPCTSHVAAYVSFTATGPRQKEKQEDVGLSLELKSKVVYELLARLS